MKNKTLAKIISNIALKMALKAQGSASMWGVYQPKEPKNIVDFKK